MNSYCQQCRSSSVCWQTGLCSICIASSLSITKESTELGSGFCDSAFSVLFSQRHSMCSDTDELPSWGGSFQKPVPDCQTHDTQCSFFPSPSSEEPYYPSNVESFAGKADLQHQSDRSNRDSEHLPRRSGELPAEKRQGRDKPLEVSEGRRSDLTAFPRSDLTAFPKPDNVLFLKSRIAQLDRTASRFERTGDQDRRRGQHANHAHHANHANHANPEHRPFNRQCRPDMHKNQRLRPTDYHHYQSKYLSTYQTTGQRPVTPQQGMGRSKLPAERSKSHHRKRLCSTGRIRADQIQRCSPFRCAIFEPRGLILAMTLHRRQ